MKVDVAKQECIIIVENSPYELYDGHHFVNVLNGEDFEIRLLNSHRTDRSHMDGDKYYACKIDVYWFEVTMVVNDPDGGSDVTAVNWGEALGAVSWTNLPGPWYADKWEVKKP